MTLPSFLAPACLAQFVPGATASAPPRSGVPAPATAATPLPAVQNFQFSAAHQSPLALQHPWITHTLAALFMLAAVGLIVLLAVQTTKQEGLSGTLGGRVESVYRTRLGFDRQLARITSIVAIAFVIIAFLISLSGI